MYVVVMVEVSQVDIFIGVVVVVDYWVVSVVEYKLKKDVGGILVIELVENLDILVEVVVMKNGLFCVGFVVESWNLEEYVQIKWCKKNVLLIVGNLIQEGFGGEDNCLVFFDDVGVYLLIFVLKVLLVRQLIEYIVILIGIN